MTSTEPKPWAIYCRISYVRRVEDGKVETLGVDRQEPPSRELIEHRLGGRVARVFIDNDVSAYSGRRRPAYDEMLQWARDGRIAGIAAWHADRLTRRPIENEELIDLAERHGVKLATVTGEHDLSTPSGRLQFRLLGNIARYESEHKAERLRLKFDELAEAGLPKGTGKRPFGYERDGMTVREDEAALLMEAAERLLAGEPMHAVIGDWDARGVTAVMGGSFTTTSLRRALLAPRTAGLRQHRGQILGPAKWPAILTTEQHERLLAHFARPDRKRLGRPRTYLYSGFLRCGRPECGSVMVGASGGANKPMYGCRGGTTDPDHQGCGRTFISKQAFEEVMDEAVIVHLCGPGFARALDRRLAAAAADDPTPAQLDADRRELAKLARLKGEGRVTIQEWLALRDPIQRRIEEAEARLAARPNLKALVDLPMAEADFRAAWARWTVQEKRQRLGAVLDYVVIKAKGRGRRFDPDRIDPHWKV